MGRTVAIVWHASFSVIAAVLYFLFVLPRWWELTDETPHTLGTVLRIVAAAFIGLAALPVVFTWLRTRQPEFGTPQLALTLRIASIAGHALAGLLIAGTAISEIWLSLDDYGPWLFGIYGAAAAVALLGISAFYLSFVAELPPPPPAPLKPKKPKKPKQSRRGRKDDADAEEAEGAEESDDTEAAEETDESEDTEAAEGTEDTEATEATTEDTEQAEVVEPAETEVAAAAEEAAATEEVSVTNEPTKARGLKNRRPSGKVTRRSPSKPE